MGGGGGAAPSTAVLAAAHSTHDFDLSLVAPSTFSFSYTHSVAFLNFISFPGNTNGSSTPSLVTNLATYSRLQEAQEAF